MMKKIKLLVSIIIAVILFSRGNLNVNAENYVATSAPDSFHTNTNAFISEPMTDVWNGLTNTSDRDVVMYNASLKSASVGDDLKSYCFTNKYGYVQDIHIRTSETTVGDKIFVIDGMESQYCGLLASCQYVKLNDSVDLGIVYIITNAENYLTKNGINPNTTTNGNLLLSWFTQVAIWKYQNINNFASVSISNNNIEKHIPRTGSYDIFCDERTSATTISTNASTLWNLASNLTTEAKNLSNVSLNLHYDGNFSIQEENNKVKTSLIYASANGPFSSYALDISKAPSGTKVYSESNTVITNLSNIPKNTKFYLEIPVENIENFTYDFNITATTTASDYKGYKYKLSTADNKVVLVTHEPQQIHSAIEVKATHVEDSASSIPKIIYIVGLFILLCGIGIVYVNMKPRKQES